MSDSRLKESNIEWLGEIPKDWNLMPIKYGIKNSVSGDWGTDPLKKSNQKKCICLRVADFDFDKGIFKQNQYTIRAYSQEKINQLKLQSGDILIEKSGGGEKQPVGRAVLFDKDFSAMFANFLVRIRTNKLLVPSFLEYYLRALYYTGSTRLYFNQTTGIQNLKVGTLLSNEKIPNISIALQNNITNYLNKRCKKVDDIIAKVQQEITDLEEYRKSIITKAVTKGIDKNVPIKNSGDKMIGEIAASFKLVPLKYVANDNLHTLSDDTNPDFCFKYIDIGSVTTGHINKYQKLRFADAPSRARRLVKNNDIIISTVRTYLKAIAFIQDLQKTTVVSTGFIVLSPKKNLIDPVYLRYAIENESFISKVQAYSVGITYPAINSSTIMNFKLVYPPFNAQKEIASYLDKKCKSINQIIEKKRTLINSLNQYKQSIIYEYVTGKKPVPTEEGVQE